MDELLRRQTKKIALVTWTDNRDFSWAGGFAPVRVTLDAAEEEPEYHQRMTAYLAQPGSLLRRPGVLAVGARVPARK